MISSVPSVEFPSLIMCSTWIDCNLIEFRLVDIVEDELPEDIIVEEPDLEKATEDLKTAQVVKPTEEESVVHEGDKGVWQPDARGKVAANKEILEQIEKLGELRVKGLITEEEFQKKKWELLR